MADLHRIRRSGDGYTVRPTTLEEYAVDRMFEGAAKGIGYLAGGVISAGVGGITKLVRNAQDRRMVSLAQELNAAEEASDIDRLLELSGEFVRRYPLEEYGHCQLALALGLKGRVDEAVTEVNRAVELGFDEFQAVAMRADFYESAGQIGKAIQEYTVLARHPEACPVGLMGRAGCLAELGDLDQALSDANDAVASMPSEQTYFVRGNIHRLMGHPEKCLADYGRAIRIRPDIADLLECRAEVLEFLGRTDEAAGDRAAAAVARRKESPNVYVGHGGNGEVQDFLILLHQQGTQLSLSANGKAIKFSGAPMRSDNIETYERLKGQIIECLNVSTAEPEIVDTLYPDMDAGSFLALLQHQGTQLELSANARAIKFLGSPMQPENIPTYERLKPEIMQRLTGPPR